MFPFEGLSKNQLARVCRSLGLEFQSERSCLVQVMRLAASLHSPEVAEILLTPEFESFFVMETKKLASLAQRELLLTRDELLKKTRGEVCCLLVLKRQISLVKMRSYIADNEDECLEVLRFILNLRKVYPFLPQVYSWQGREIKFYLVERELVPARENFSGQLEQLKEVLSSLSVSFHSLRENDLALDEEKNLWLIGGWKSLCLSQFQVEKEEVVLSHDLDEDSSSVVDVSTSSSDEDDFEVFDY